jgi:hypothetical protein
MIELPDEEEAMGHARIGGHACGTELSMRTFAAAVLRKVEGAYEVYVTPTHTFVAMGDGSVARYENGPEMRAALDEYLLTSDVSALDGKTFTLVPPT